MCLTAGRHSRYLNTASDFQELVTSLRCRPSGAETQLGILASELVGMGVDLGVFYVDGIETNDSVRYYKCRDGHYPIKLVNEIILAIKEFNPDLVHVWVPSTINIASLIAAKYCSKPVISSIRNKRKIDGFLRLISFIATYIFADKIVTNNSILQSSWLYQWLYHKKNGVHIGNAVCKPYDTCFNKKTKNDYYKIVYIGRLTSQKNVPLLIDALKDVDDKRRWRLFIYGKGDDETDIRTNIIENCLETSVSLHGYKEDVYETLQSADLLVLPSSYEGMPNVVVEALSYEVPALVSNISAHTLLFVNGEVGFFENGNKESLKVAVESYMDHKIDIQTQIRKGKAFALGHSPQKICLKYIKTYKKLFKQG